MQQPQGNEKKKEGDSYLTRPAAWIVIERKRYIPHAHTHTQPENTEGVYATGLHRSPYFLWSVYEIPGLAVVA